MGINWERVMDLNWLMGILMGINWEKVKEIKMVIKMGRDLERVKLTLKD